MLSSLTVDVAAAGVTEDGGADVGPQGGNAGGGDLVDEGAGSASGDVEVGAVRGEADELGGVVATGDDGRLEARDAGEDADVHGEGGVEDGGADGVDEVGGVVVTRRLGRPARLGWRRGVEGVDEGWRNEEEEKEEEGEEGDEEEGLRIQEGGGG